MNLVLGFKDGTSCSGTSWNEDQWEVAKGRERERGEVGETGVTRS